MTMTAPTPKTYVERDMLELLHARYSGYLNGTAERYLVAEHVQVGTHGRIADFIAQDRYRQAGNGYKNIIIGHEVKVTRSDWLVEKRNPHKAEAIKRYCDQWFLVVPDKSIVKDGELPEGWGLLVMSKAGKLRPAVKAPMLEPDPLDHKFMSSFTHAAVRTAQKAPLYRKAESVNTYPDGTWDGRVEVCQACGTPTPCAFHQ